MRYVECTICLQRISLGYPEGPGRTTGPAKKHLSKKHPEIFKQLFPGPQPMSYQQISQDSIQTDAPRKYQRIKDPKHGKMQQGQDDQSPKSEPGLATNSFFSFL